MRRLDSNAYDPRGLVSPGPPPTESHSSDAPGRDGEARATLSRDLSELLIELSIAVHRYAMYPGTHPSLLPAAENVVGRLGELFEDRESLSIGVARDQLIIEGVATDPKHPVLKDLARRLHDHQLSAVAFEKGVRLKEVQAMLAALAADSERDDPMGLLPHDQMPDWENAHLYPVGYDQLELDEGDEAEGPSGLPSRVMQLWVGMARAALGSDDALDAEDVPEVEVLAEEVARKNRDEAYDQVIVGYLLQLAEELKNAEGGDAEVVRQRMSKLIGELDDATLERLVEMRGSYDKRKKLVLDANKSLTVEAVTKIVRAAAETSGQTISSSMTRLLSKMALHAEEGPGRVRSQADTALRENVEELIENWELKDPNPDQYTMVLDSMARSNPVFRSGEANSEDEDEDDEERLDGPIRILSTALEVDAWGPIVERAVSDLLDVGELGQVLTLLDEAPEGSQVAETLGRELTTSSRISRLLEGEDVDEETLKLLVRRTGAPAVDPLLQALTESGSRSIRRKVFDCLADLPPEFPVAERAIALLSDKRWYVKRNMLGLLQDLRSLPQDFSALPYLRHKEARVRREAFPVAVRDPMNREEALFRALSDQDERLVRMALVNGQEGLPERCAAVVTDRIIRNGEMKELRFAAVRALRASKSAPAKEGLLETAMAGRGLFGRKKLAEKSGELLVALAGLAEHWREDPDAAEVLGLAESSNDPEIQAAARGDRP